MSPHFSPVTREFAALVARQSIADQARATLGSWDSCMSKAYCKWPVVAVIIIGSLIVLSILLCIARFCCCGIECCCGICSCFNHCCPSPRRKDKTQYASAPQYPPQQPYGYQPPMNYGYAPQYATYDVSKNQKVTEDALPAMPSWEQSQTKRVEDTTYHAPTSNEIATQDFGHNGQGAMAMGALGGARPGVKDDDMLYEEDDQHQPMSGEQQQPSRPISPYVEPQQEEVYARPYDHQGNPYSPSVVGAYAPPQQQYNDYNQQQYPSQAAGYGDKGPISPASSMYTSGYPQSTGAFPSRAPTYRSEAPTYHTQAPAHHQAMPTSQQYLSELGRQRDYGVNSPQEAPNAGQYQYGNGQYTGYGGGDDQSTRYEPTQATSPAAELPGSLSIGGNRVQSPRYYGQQPSNPYQMGGGSGVRRKPL